MERYCHGSERSVEMFFVRKTKEHAGQSTVEYVVVLSALLAVVVGLGALVHLFADGTVANHAVFSASHQVGGESLGAVLDIFTC